MLSIIELFVMIAKPKPALQIPPPLSALLLVIVLLVSIAWSPL
ncbi:MAG: hypothetical protein N2201_03770 [candidate division WOR-3 bacterium]|nr:hypothetical protein [candidate division WOR-3 bacterium]